MPTMFQLFSSQPLLPIYAQPLNTKTTIPGSIMESARLPSDCFLVYAEEGATTAPVVVHIKKITDCGGRTHDCEVATPHRAKSLTLYH